MGRWRGEEGRTWCQSCMPTQIRPSGHHARSAPRHGQGAQAAARPAAAEPDGRHDGRPALLVEASADRDRIRARRPQVGANSVQHATYSVQRATCSVQHAACNVQRATCNVQRAACNMQRAACNMQRARNVQRAADNLQRAADNVQRTTCKRATDGMVHVAWCTFHGASVLRCHSNTVHTHRAGKFVLSERRYIDGPALVEVRPLPRAATRPPRPLPPPIHCLPLFAVCSVPLPLSSIVQR